MLWGNLQEVTKTSRIERCQFCNMIGRSDNRTHYRPDVFQRRKPLVALHFVRNRWVPNTRERNSSNSRAKELGGFRLFGLEHAQEICVNIDLICTNELDF